MQFPSIQGIFSGTATSGFDLTAFPLTGIIKIPVYHIFYVAYYF